MRYLPFWCCKHAEKKHQNLKKSFEIFHKAIFWITILLLSFIYYILLLLISIIFVKHGKRYYFEWFVFVKVCKNNNVIWIRICIQKKLKLELYVVLPTEVQRRNYIRHYKTHFLRLFCDVSSIYSQFLSYSALLLLHHFLRRVKRYSRNNKKDA